MTLFIHVGRNKAGSLTIQRFLSANRASLARLGVEYPDVGRIRFSHRGLAEELRFNSAEGNVAEGLRNLLQHNSASRFLISSEHLFDAPHHVIRDLVMLAGPHDIKVIAYIRQYPDWARSKYAQATKKGRNAADFDAFFAAMSRKLSALPALQRWANVLGWENMRVRFSQSGLPAGWKAYR